MQYRGTIIIHAFYIKINRFGNFYRLRSKINNVKISAEMPSLLIFLHCICTYKRFAPHTQDNSSAWCRGIICESGEGRSPPFHSNLSLPIKQVIDIWINYDPYLRSRPMISDVIFSPAWSSVQLVSLPTVTPDAVQFSTPASSNAHPTT